MRRRGTTTTALACVVVLAACGGGEQVTDDDAATPAPSSPAAVPVEDVNPVINDDFPDPDVLEVDGVYYAYGTNGNLRNVRVARSTDLEEWELLDDALFQPSAPLSKHARRIVLEMTERMSLESIPDARSRVAALKELGFRIALDDMGAGYAGLTSFAMLEPQYVKIDLGLVRNVDTEAIKQTLIRTIVRLAEDLDIDVIAEGVETRAEAEALARIGCPLLQGYLFARPAPPFVEVSW